MRPPEKRTRMSVNQKGLEVSSPFFYGTQRWG